MTLYAIGDVHGQMAGLERAIRLIEADGGAGARIIFVGDYTDRGPASRAVLEYLTQGLDAGQNWVCLMGNHDRMMAWFLEDHPRHDPHLPVGLYWLHPRLGGDTTLASYGVEVTPERRLADVHAEARAAVPADHLHFLRSRPVLHQEDGILFAHAGIRPGVPVAEQSENDLIWIRREFLKSSEPYPFVVHGHTPVDTPEHVGTRINLDGGAGYGRPLVPVALEGGLAFTLTEHGRVPLMAPGNRP